MDIDWNETLAAIWRPRSGRLRPVRSIDPVTLDGLIGIDGQKAELVRNTERFLDGRPANNALLWGARGTGKSSLIKALLNDYGRRGLRLIEVARDSLVNLPEMVDAVRERPQRFLIFCDDLSFEASESAYIALKTVLEGSIEQPPENVLLYATSNRRHLMPESMRDNLDTRLVDGEVHDSDTVEERISLSDRFGLWLAFHPQTLDGYLAIVDRHFPDPPDREALHAAARRFAADRASHSGRTARQFFNAHAEGAG